MPDAFKALRAAKRIDTAVRDVRLFANHLAPTHGAFARHAPALLRLLDAHDLGDHVARAVDDHARAQVNALLVDLGLVVHGDIADRHTADDHRFHMRDRRQHPGPSDVARDLLDIRLRLLWRVLEGDRPARRARDETQLELLVEAVDLDDDAVDLVLQLVALALPFGVILDHLVDARQPAPVLVDAEPHPFERAEHVPLR